MEKGDEDGLRQRQAEVHSFWEKVEEEHIKPMLETYDEKTRAILEKALYLREDNKVSHGQDEHIIPTEADSLASQTQTDADVDPPAITEDQVSESQAVRSEVEDHGSKSKIQPLTNLKADMDDSERSTTVLEAIKKLRNAYIMAKRAYRIQSARLNRVREALSLFEGTRNYHNYTVQKAFSDPSAKRVIKSFVVNPEPILINSTEWLSLKVHGQSFMMHQIRKMVGMVALVVRCGCDPKRITESYGPENISIPKAPSLGLLLERPVFDSYNKRAKHDLGKAPIDFDKFKKEMDEFKQRQIYERMYRDEEKDNM